MGLVLLSLLLMFADNRFDYLSQVRYYASFVVTPVHWLADGPQQMSGSFTTFFKKRNDLMDDNESLREELLLQKVQLQKLGHLDAENKRLNGLLNASSIVDGIVVRAQLMGESPDPFSKKVIINKGSRDGVYVGQPVLDADGLFGQVVELEAYSSWVLLVTDPHHSTPIQINRNGVRAVASGTHDSLHQMVLNNMPDTADIEVGDVLVTSGLGQRFPVGYPVGVISSIIHDGGQPFAIVTVLPTAQLDKSRNLLLVF